MLQWLKWPLGGSRTRAVRTTLLEAQKFYHEKHFYSTSRGSAYPCYGGRSVFSSRVSFVAEPLLVPWGQLSCSFPNTPAAIVLKQWGFWDGVQGPPGLRSSSLWPLLSFLPFFFPPSVIQALTHGGWTALLTFPCLRFCKFPDNSSGRRVCLLPCSVCVCYYQCLHMSLAYVSICLHMSLS